jgi:aspartate kinase
MSTNQNLRVLKFGGSSLATPEQIRSVAQNIFNLHQSGKKLIVVVSAMGRTTDQLLTLARQVSKSPNRRELDMLLTTGERVSMALMSMALHDLGCPSISFTGSQAGVMTDSSHSNARILEIKPFRVAEALAENKVVVLAGFQGVDPNSKEITTLGRGGSDTTAVAMAAHFNASRCEILKDVDGVFSSDPKIVNSARLYAELPLTILYEFCFWGAKVLNYRSVEWARQKKVPLFIGRSDNFKIGTQCSSETFSSPSLMGVNSHINVVELSAKAAHISEATHSITDFSDQLGLPAPQILKAEIHDGDLKLLITNESETLNEFANSLADSKDLHLSRRDISSVTETYADGRSLTHIVNSKDREPLIQKLHEKIEHEP